MLNKTSIIINLKLFKNILGQGDSLHKRISSKHSLHFSLFFKQARLRFCIPPPHVFEQTSHSSFEQIISGHGSSSRSTPIHNRPLFFG